MGLMEISPFGLSKVGRGEDIDILGEGVKLPHVKKTGSSSQFKRDKPLLGKEIRPVLPTPWKARQERRYGFTMWKHL